MDTVIWALLYGHFVIDVRTVLQITSLPSVAYCFHFEPLQVSTVNLPPSLKLPHDG
jgi:hypothetical protein